ncbi:MAG: hypothetical protein ABIP55_09000 [Tepidisphaeraceae bacterium]
MPIKTVRSTAPATPSGRSVGAVDFICNTDRVRLDSPALGTQPTYTVWEAADTTERTTLIATPKQYRLRRFSRACPDELLTATWDHRCRVARARWDLAFNPPLNLIAVKAIGDSWD